MLFTARLSSAYVPRKRPIARVMCRHGRALSIVEVLIGLVIGATMLTSLATAVVGGLNAAKGNVDQFRAIQTGRVVVMRIIADVRNAYDLDLEDAAAVANSTITGKCLRVRANPTVNPIAYRYTASGTYPHQLRYYSNALSSSDRGSRLAGDPFEGTATKAGLNVSVTDVTYSLTYDKDLNTTNFTVTITLNQGKAPLLVSESVMPRRVMAAH